MSINGRVGRVKFFSSHRKMLQDEAKKHGVDTDDRHAFNTFVIARSRATLAGIRERSKCGCGGTSHATITGWEKQ